MKQSQKAFTLVELIVVITILAILGTIAFISLQGYSKSSRDSVRISDISKMKSSLELFNIDAGKYPETTNGVAVTFSGVNVWTQGVFGELTFNNVNRLDKIPKDPLTDKEYTYSVTNTRQEYEIAGLMESDDFTYNPYLLNTSYGAEKIATAKVTGNYNGKIAKVYTGGKIYVLAVPAIISASGITLEDIITNKSFVYNGYSNLPFSYSGSAYNTLGETDLNLVDANNYIVYSGSLATLSGENSDARISMLQNLQTAYTGSVIEDNAISEIMAITDFTSTNSIVVSLAGTVVNNTLGGSIVTTSSNDGSPIDTTPPSDYIAYYPLTGTAEDMTGNYNGTENGNTYINDTNRGAVASFNNTGKNISINYDIGTSIVSISTWIKSSVQPYNQRIFDSSSNNYSGLVQIVLDTNGNITVMQGNNSSLEEWVSGTINVGDNNWHLVTTVINGNNVNIYVDGIFDTSGSTGVSLGNDSSAFIGNTSNGSNGFNGVLSNFKIFNRSISQTEITNIYNAELNTNTFAVSDGLVAYYPLKNNSMDNWYNQYDGSNVGGVSYDGNSASFNGINYILPSVFGNLTTFSASFFVKSSSITSGHSFLFGDQAFGQVFVLDGTLMIYHITDGTSRTYSGTPPLLSDDAWYHITLVVDNGTDSIYIDGVNYGSSGNNISLNNVYIGTASTQPTVNTYALTGNMSDIRIYNRVLSSEEVLSIYNFDK